MTHDINNSPTGTQSTRASHQELWKVVTTVMRTANSYIYSSFPSWKKKQPIRALWVGLRIASSSDAKTTQRIQQINGHKNHGCWCQLREITLKSRYFFDWQTGNLTFPVLTETDTQWTNTSVTLVFFPCKKKTVNMNAKWDWIINKFSSLLWLVDSLTCPHLALRRLFSQNDLVLVC